MIKISPRRCALQSCCTSRDEKLKLMLRKRDAGSLGSCKLCGIGVGFDPVLLATNEGAIVMSLAENGTLFVCEQGLRA